MRECRHLVYGIFERRMFPLVAFEPWGVGRAGQGLRAHVADLVDVCGPQYQLFRAFCRRVRAVTTDFGVERKLYDFANVPLDFVLAFSIANRRRKMTTITSSRGQ